MAGADMWRLSVAVLSLARLFSAAAQKDDLPAGGSDSGAAATATVGEWVAVVMFLIIALVLSVMYAMKNKSDLDLDTLEHSTLVTSWNTTPQRLLAIRCAIMVFMGSTVMFLIDPLHKGVAGVGDAFFCKFTPAVCCDPSARACVFLSLFNCAFALLAVGRRVHQLGLHSANGLLCFRSCVQPQIPSDRGHSITSGRLATSALAALRSCRHVGSVY